jgi:RNA polymerase sigma-70 factor (ECF subfamily)
MDPVQIGQERAQVTTLLQRVKDGDSCAKTDLIPLIYNELHAIARNYMQRERPNHTLQATVLVHEAFLQLVGNINIDWQNRAHFFALASHAMRRILIHYARRAHAEKRPGAHQQVELDSGIVTVGEQATDLLALDEALGRLAALNLRQSQIVEMRFFAGLSFEEIGAVMGISVRTAKRDWMMARAWLYTQLTGGPKVTSFDSKS